LNAAASRFTRRALQFLSRVGRSREENRRLGRLVGDLQGTTTEGGSVSDQDSSNRPTEDEDVEAHRKSNVMASEEAPKDDESDDDVELHGRNTRKAL
jgi:hypothetical protein